jgi:hypothetical protein
MSFRVGGTLLSRAVAPRLQGNPLHPSRDARMMAHPRGQESEGLRD